MFILLRWGLSDYTLITFSKIKSRLCLSSLILMGSFGLTGVRVPGGARWLGPRKGFYFFAVRATKPWFSGISAWAMLPSRCDCLLVSNENPDYAVTSRFFIVLYVFWIYNITSKRFVSMERFIIKDTWNEAVMSAAVKGLHRTASLSTTYRAKHITCY